MRNTLLKILGNKEDIGWMKAYEWMGRLSDRQKELKKKGDEYFHLIFEGKWIGSRLWGMWEDKTQKLRSSILIAKIFFGTDLKTPIEFGIDEAEAFIRKHADVENEIDFWCNQIDKGKVIEWSEDDAADIKKCYSSEGAKYIFDKISACLKKSL